MSPAIDARVGRWSAAHPAHSGSATTTPLRGGCGPVLGLAFTTLHALFPSGLASLVDAIAMLSLALLLGRVGVRGTLFCGLLP